MKRIELAGVIDFVNFGAFAIICILFGFLFFKDYINNNKHKSNQQPLYSSNELTDNNNNNSLQKPKRTQVNPLFASSPSWYEDFDSSKQTVNTKDWNILVGPAQNSNNEQQYYTDSSTNLIVKDGTLQIIATRQDMPEGYKYSSARLESAGKKDLLYGRIDVVAKLPAGTGTWPAIWMLPANDVYAQKGSMSRAPSYKNGGEIDIMEAIGQQPNRIYGVAHSVSDSWQRSGGTGSHNLIYVPNSTTAYNKYSLLWTPDELIFEVNDKPYFSYKKKAGADYTTWPFDQPFYLIINLAMGGSWGGMDKINFPGNGIDNRALPAKFEIDSIDYYPYVGTR